uniref:Putative secreted protein n=2 Tax=Anopheles marajoara TaxID=58244 RepID=A0A2M4C575_9DIPT
MKHGTALHLVILGCFIVVHLLSGENQPLLLWRNAFLLLYALLNPVHFVRRLDVDFDLLAGQSLHFDEHDYNDR